MKKKILILVLGLILVTGSLMVSSGNAKEAKLAPATVKFWFPSDGEVNDNYFLNAVQEFQTKYPSIKVEVTKLPTSGTDISLKLNAASLSGDYPDVFSFYIAHLVSRGAKGELADLSPYFNKWSDKGDIVKSAVDAGFYRNKQLGLCYYPAPVLLVYRTDYFKGAGLDPAKPPRTWEDIRNYAYKLVKKDASGKVVRAGMDIPALDVGVPAFVFMRQGGSLIVDEKAEKPACSDKGAVAAFNFMVSLKDQSIPFDGQKLNDYPFMKGNAAMSLINIGMLSSFLANNPSLADKVAYAPVTKQAKQIAFCGNRFFGIGANSKYKAQSWEFIKFMMTKEQMMKRAKEVNIPVVRKSLEPEYIALNPGLNKVIMDYTRMGKPNPAVPWFSAFVSYLQTAYEEVYTGKKSAQQALQDVENKINKEVGLSK